MRRFLVTTVWCGLLAAPLTAQQAGTIELGGFVRYNDYDKSYDTSRKDANQWGGGGRLGIFFSHRFAVEADASGNATDVKQFFTGYESTALTYYPIHLRLMFNHRFGENGPFFWFLGAGPGYNRYGKRVPNEPGFKGSDWAVGGITGFRAMLTSWLAFRVDGTLDYIWSPNNGKAAIVNQAAGITAASPPNHNLNLGAQAGLSIMLGMCNRSKDGTIISPTTATLQPGQTASFSATAINCGHEDQVNFTATGGSISPAGMFTAAQPGSAAVKACGERNRLCATANITVAAPAPMPPPAPAAPTITRCELAPPTASVRIDQPVSYRVTCSYSDGTSKAIDQYTLSSPGGAVAFPAISWPTPGMKNVTAVVPSGPTLSATADVQQIHLVISDAPVVKGGVEVKGGAHFEFDKSAIYRPGEQDQLKDAAQTLIQHPEIKLVIDGHTDADGTVKYNAGLGMRRATAVKNYLASQGVPVDRMTIILRSFGECQPVVANATAAGRAANRRAEVTEFGNTQPGPGEASCKEAGRDRKP